MPSVKCFRFLSTKNAGLNDMPNLGCIITYLCVVEFLVKVSLTFCQIRTKVLHNATNCSSLISFDTDMNFVSNVKSFLIKVMIFYIFNESQSCDYCKLISCKAIRI